MTTPASERPDKPGWYECRRKGGGPAVARWWTGKQLCFVPNGAPAVLEFYTDFIGPLVPARKPGEREREAVAGPMKEPRTVTDLDRSVAARIRGESLVYEKHGRTREEAIELIAGTLANFYDAATVAGGELEAANKHLDAAYEAIGLSKYSSEPLSSAIHTLKVAAQAALEELDGYNEHGGSTKAFHICEKLRAALSTPAEQPERRE